MSRRAFPAFMVAALAGWAALSTPVAARWLNPDTAGYCVSGTCNKFGGVRAANIKFCKPENCRDYAAASLQQPVAATRPVTKKVICPATTWSWPWIWLWPHRDCGAASEK